MFRDKLWSIINTDFEIPRKIPDIPRHMAGIFVRQLATVDWSPCAAKCLFVLFWRVRIEGYVYSYWVLFSAIGVVLDTNIYFRGLFNWAEELGNSGLGG